MFQYQRARRSFDRDIDRPSLSPVGSTSARLLASPRKTKRKIPKVPFKVLDAPALQDDFYLNLVDWSSQNILAVGLGSCVYLWSACTSKVTKVGILFRGALLVDVLPPRSPLSLSKISPLTSSHLSHDFSRYRIMTAFSFVTSAKTTQSPQCPGHSEGPTSVWARQMAKCRYGMRRNASRCGQWVATRRESEQWPGTARF